ncbi:MAG TPA: DUF2510 domain-containing protein, partial [Acidimicrobiales bacterium]|nr:DUF2510 domain-containing protein [Acidimicrobiales bacterium]
ANGPGKGANDIVITLYRIPNSQDADSFASGSQKPYQQPGAASSFAVPSIPGAHGYTVSITSPTQVTEQVVLFKSDPYVAIVQLASSVATSNPAPLNPSDAISVSFQQYTAIRHFLGTPTAGAPPGTASATSKSGSIVPTVLAVIGGLVVLAAIAWMAAGPPRDRRRRRRAALFAPSHELRVPIPIDVPVADTRPVRLARGPVIRVVEVEPKTGSVVSPPRAMPAKAGPRPLSAPRPALQPVVEAEAVPGVEPQPAPAWSAAAAAPKPEPPVQPAVHTRTGFEPAVEPGPEPGVGPGAVPEFGSEPVFESAFEPLSEPVYGPVADPALEELELAESAAAELAAQELAKLGTTVDSVTRPEVGPDQGIGPPTDPVVGPSAPDHRAAWMPEPAGPGAAATPVGPFEDPRPGTPSGWLPDPSGLPDVLRYWDGQAWTFHVATRSVKH